MERARPPTWEDVLVRHWLQSAWARIRHNESALSPRRRLPDRHLRDLQRAGGVGRPPRRAAVRGLLDQAVRIGGGAEEAVEAASPRIGKVVLVRPGRGSTRTARSWTGDSEVVETRRGEPVWRVRGRAPGVVGRVSLRWHGAWVAATGDRPGKHGQEHVSGLRDE
jgi:hypothetical protein